MAQESTQSSTLPNAAVEMLWRGDVIAAIKLVRTEREQKMGRGRLSWDRF